MMELTFKRIFVALIAVTTLSCQTEQKATKEESKKVIKHDTVSLETPFEMADISVPDFGECSTFSITDFGAKEEDKIKTTHAITEAIKAANEAGCGIVKVPAGEWFTSKIHFKSNVKLHLEEGAVLSFSDKKKDYLPPVLTRSEGIECMSYSSLIYAQGCENIAITGNGKLKGNGEAWWPENPKRKKSFSYLYDMVEAGISTNERIMGTVDSLSYLIPSFIHFIDCKNILLSDFLISNGPMWTTHMVYSKNITIRNLQVITEGPNNDGLVIDSSEDVLIEDCFFSTGDDCVVIKSGLNEDGWRVNKPTKNVVVRSCTTEKGHGGVVIGSEMSGGVENILAYDCHFKDTHRGLRIKSMRGRGGYVRNIYFRDIEMDSIGGEAIRINMRYEYGTVPPRGDKTPFFDNINIENISTNYAEHALQMRGLSNQPITGIAIKDFVCKSSKYGIEMDSCSQIKLDNIRINATDEALVAFKGNMDVSLKKIFLNGKEIKQLK